MKITNALRGLAPYLPTWATDCFGNPQLNTILDTIDDNAQPLCVRVLSRFETTPPGSPSVGDKHIVGVGATGAWSGEDDNITTYNGATWDFTPVIDFQLAFVLDENLSVQYSGTAWEIYGEFPDLFYILEIENDPSTLTPSTNYTYIVGTSPVGVWAGKANQLARYNGVDWDFIIPTEPHKVYVEDASRFYEFDGTNWVAKGQTLVKTDGSTPFVSTQGGVDPVAASDLTTRNYVDTEISGISALSSDGWSPIADTLAYTSAADPEFTATFTGVDLTGTLFVGMKLKMTNTTVKYFVITKIEFSAGNTTLTLYGGTDYDLTAAAITNLYFSVAKSPAGFPADKTKWQIAYTGPFANFNIPNPVQNTWYNIGGDSVVAVTGLWYTSYSVNAGWEGTTPQYVDMEVTLSDAPNTELANDQFSHRKNMRHEDGVYKAFSHDFQSRKILFNVPTITTYYLNGRSTQPGMQFIAFNGGPMLTHIDFECAYI